MDWDDLHTVLAIARAGTLSGAARALGLRQSSVSRRLAALEARAGARLLERLPGGYRLTPTGEAVRTHAERMEAEALAAARVVRGRDAALEGQVVLTTVELLATRLVPQAIARLHARHPGIVVDVLPETRSLSLSRREADLALRMVPFEGAEVHTRRIGALAVSAYAAESYVVRHGTPGAVPREGGAGHAIVTVLDDQAHLAEPRHLAAWLPRARVALRSNNRDVQVAAAAAGLGIGLFSRLQGDAMPGVVRLEMPPEPGGPGATPGLRGVWLGVHADMRTMPRIRAVIEALDDEFRAQRHLLAPVS